jgi:nicotinate-nucleotide pyrophosphorylase (carboxylating)
MKSHDSHLPADIAITVARALDEDIGTGDLTAGLLPAEGIARASVICREPAVVCGIPWFNQVYRQLDPSFQIKWNVNDGDHLQPNQSICTLEGNVRTMLTGERTALNFLQLLSGTATVTREYVALLQGTSALLLDTRKTIPGLRTAQKYAVVCGGGNNHRLGLYDAILIKENHISAAGSIADVLRHADSIHDNVEIEVETLEQLEQALGSGANKILLDNFDLTTLRKAVKLNAGRAKLEVSGGVTRESLRAIAATGVDYISVGALTKHVRAIDYSLRIDNSTTFTGGEPASS